MNWLWKRIGICSLIWPVFIPVFISFPTSDYVTCPSSLSLPGNVICVFPLNFLSDRVLLPRQGLLPLLHGSKWQNVNVIAMLFVFIFPSLSFPLHRDSISYLITLYSFLILSVQARSHIKSVLSDRFKPFLSLILSNSILTHYKIIYVENPSEILTLSLNWTSVVWLMCLENNRLEKWGWKKRNERYRVCVRSEKCWLAPVRLSHIETHTHEGTLGTNTLFVFIVFVFDKGVGTFVICDRFH